MATNPLEDFVRNLCDQASRAELDAYNDRQLLQRYVDSRDEYAFAAVIRRHERRIWGVCLRVLGRHEDAEDAFQATCLILAQKAAKVQWREAIDGWLHNVAHKIATKAKTARERRRVHEERKAKMQHESSDAARDREEWAEVLDRELTYVPEAYRTPLILCYLEGLSNEQAAVRLHISLRSLKKRLAKGRRRMQSRLSKRGMDFVGTMSLAGSPGVTPSLPPAGLAVKALHTVRIWTQAQGAVGAATGGSTTTIVLAEEMLSVGALKIKILLGLLFATLALAGGGVYTYSVWMRPGKEPPLNEIAKVEEASSPASTANDAPAGRIDFYGDPLPGHALARIGTVRLRCQPPGRFNSLQFSPDGKTLATGGMGTPFSTSVHLWEVGTGREIRRLGAEYPWTGISFFNAPPAIFSRDNRLIATVDTDREEQVWTIKLWETATGKLAHKYRAPELPLLRKANGAGAAERPFTKTWIIRSLVFSLDGELRTLLTTSSHELCLWEPSTGRLVPMSEPDEIKEICFSADGRMAASDSQRLSEEGLKTIVSVWDAASGKRTHQLEATKDVWKNDDGDRTEEWFYRVLEESHPRILFSPDDKTLAYGGDVWEMPAGKKLPWTERRKIGGLVRFVCYSPDGKAILSRQMNEKGKEFGYLRDVATGEKIRTIDWTRAAIAEFSPNGGVLAAVTNDGVIRLWNATNGKEMGPCVGYRTPMNSLAYSTDAKVVVTDGGRYDKTVHWWDAGTGKEIRRRLQIHPQVKFNADVRHETSHFSSDGRLRAIELKDSAEIGYLIEDATTGKTMCTIEPDLHQDEPLFSPDGKRLAAACDGEIHVYDAVTGQCIYELTNDPPTRDRCTLAFSADGKTLAAASHSSAPTGNILARFWDMGAGKETNCLPKGKDENGAYYITFAPDGKLLTSIWAHDEAGGCWLDLWDAAASRRVAQFAKRKNMSKVTFSPDGRLAASVEERDRNVYLIDVFTGQEICSLRGHQGAVNNAVFSPDGRTLTSASDDATCLIWDVTSIGRTTEPLPNSLSDKELETAWRDLGQADVKRIYQALIRLTASPRQTISLIKSRLRPTFPPADPQQLERWIADLDAQTFVARQQAQQNIEGLGEAAVSQLQQALKGKLSLETRKRLQDMLAKLKLSAREYRGVQVLEAIGTPDAQQVLQGLANGVPEAKITQEAQKALARLSK